MIRFVFPNAGVIDVEGGWEVRDDSGELVDQSRGRTERSCYCVHRILGSPVQRYVVDAPTSFTLYFENGLSLSVIDDSDHYESFSIQPDGVYV